MDGPHEEVYKNTDLEEIDEISNILDKIISAVRAKPELITRFFFGEFTPFRFTQAAGNHAFDDYPEFFGITKWEGHRIRAWVHNKVETKLTEEKRVVEDPDGLIKKITLDT